MNEYDKELLEVIVVDDGSEDNTCDAVLRYSEDIVIYKKKNGGQSSARNMGVEKACGKWVWFVDADDYLNENAVKLLMHKLHFVNSDICLISFNLIKGNGEVIASHKASDRCRTGNVYDIHDMLVWSYVINKDFLNKFSIKFMEGVFHEDVDYCTRMLCQTMNITYCNDVKYFYVQNDKSTTRGGYNVKRACDIFRIANEMRTFYEGVSSEQKRFIAFNIARLINSILQEFKQDLNIEKQDAIKKMFRENKSFLFYFWRAGTAKYRLEYILLHLSVNLTIKIMQRM